MKRNKFSLSHYNLLSCNMGELIPLTWMEVLPGDTFQQATASLIRLLPMEAPVMHPCKVRIHHWFVPMTELWADFESFITGGDDGLDATEWPYLTLSSCTSGSLHDHLGVPPAASYSSLKVSAIPFRAYNFIYNKMYRDQDLITALTVSTGNGNDTTTDTTIQKIAWEKDKFTSARPYQQKGSEVNITLGENAPVVGIGTQNQTYPYASGSAYETEGSGTETYANYKMVDGGAANQVFYVEEDPNNTGYPGIFADLANAEGIPISEFREAIQTQAFMERMNRGGSRYSDYLRQLGIMPDDLRMHEPLYLGGGKQTIKFSEVLQTAEGASTEVGEMKGHGVGAVRSNRYRKFFKEHGVIMSLMSIQPKAIYSQALNRKFFRETKYDYFQKEFQLIGDAPILNKEVYAEHTTPDGVFGYNQRYDSYKYHPSSIHGDFHSSLDHWHLARIHSSDPSLNQSFIECDPSDRIFASTSTDNIIVMAHHSIQARRMMYRNAIPKTL